MGVVQSVEHALGSQGHMHHARPAGGELHGGRPPEAGAAARDHDHLPVEKTGGEDARGHGRGRLSCGAMAPLPEPRPAVLPLPGGRQGATVRVHPLLCGLASWPEPWAHREEVRRATMVNESRLKEIVFAWRNRPRDEQVQLLEALKSLSTDQVSPVLEAWSAVAGKDMSARIEQLLDRHQSH